MSDEARFFAPPPQWDLAARSMRLDAIETRHCTTVLRCRPGDRIRVFDGEGREARALVRATYKKSTELEIDELAAPAPAPPPLLLATAVPKGKLFEWMIEKAVELGVTEICPLITQRTIVRLEASAYRERQQKWQHVAVEACKQCGQNWLPWVREPATLEGFCASRKVAEFDLALVGSLEPGAASLHAIVAAFQAETKRQPATAGLIIGPEGDLTADEYALTRDHGWRAISFGALTLRVGTAAIFGISILRHELAPEARLADEE